MEQQKKEVSATVNYNTGVLITRISNKTATAVVASSVFNDKSS